MNKFYKNILIATLFFPFFLKADILEITDQSILEELFAMAKCPCVLSEKGERCDVDNPAPGPCEVDTSELGNGSCATPGQPLKELYRYKKHDKCGSKTGQGTCTLKLGPYCSSFWVSFCETVYVTSGHIADPPEWGSWFLGLPPISEGFFCAARRPEETTEVGERYIGSGENCK